MNNLAVVIGSGSVMCAASIGLLKVLHREGIPIGMLVGSSGGSIYAASIALGYTTEQIEQLSLQLWTSDLFEGYASNLRATLSGESQFTELTGMIDDQPMLRQLRMVFEGKNFNDTQIPLFIVSTDFYSGESITHNEGSILDAVRASIAIPLVFSPWKIGEQLLVDGAVSNPLPVDVAIMHGAGLILAMGFELPLRRRTRSYTAVTSHFNSIYMNNILKARFSFFNAVHHAEIIPILPEFQSKISTFDVDKIPHIIEQGERATEQQIGYIKRLLAAG
jgi:NTE family protein